ncbi:EmrB/QacA subfamily drug resistance transporter [Actinokineospora baliensis]|uniref:MFS transporter n=1 Tax=Actinokineospora baliensis TaxID=547056 RepID=UPI0027DCF339|nr:MFS transporter [Actinokineospora baliensis]MBM7771527.1 EmrB/QacA subfamily drug resistance transporter [Actinokineospora baliensis]
MTTQVRWGTAGARGVLATTILGSGMAMLDSSVVNIALPRLGHELGASVSGLQWVLDGYLLALAALILVAGSLGDRYGRRRVFVVGVVWFGVASVLCGLAVSTPMLVASRILQGIGGALLTPGSLAILQAVFHREDRARAIGTWSGLGGIAAAVGPLVGGLLVQLWSWRLAFLVNIPLVVVCVLLAMRYVPETRDEEFTGHPNVLDSVLGAVGLAGITAALVELPVRGPDWLVVGSGVVGVVSFTAFVLLQRRQANPLVPPALFANHTFVVANSLTLVVYAALTGVMMLMGLQLQTSLGYSPTAAGVAGLPITLIMLALSARSGQLAARWGPRWFLVLGPLVIAAAMLLMTRITPGASYWGSVLPSVLLFGLGLSIVVAPVTATVLAAAPDRYAGMASGVNNAVARTGGLLAVAVLPAAAGLTGAAYTDPTALTSGWRTALLICAGLAAVGGLLALSIRDNVLAPSTPPHSCAIDSPPTQVAEQA